MMIKFRLATAATLAVALLGQVDSLHGSTPPGGAGPAPTPKPKFDPCIEACVTHYANKRVGNPAYQGDFMYEFLTEKTGIWSEEDIKQRFQDLEASQENKSTVYSWSKWIIEQAAQGINAAITTVKPEIDFSEAIKTNLGSCHEMCTSQLWKFKSENIKRRDQPPPMPGAGREEAAAPVPPAVEGQQAQSSVAPSPPSDKLAEQLRAALEKRERERARDEGSESGSSDEGSGSRSSSVDF